MAIEGDLQDMSLVDIIQLNCRNQEASAVSLSRGDREGAIYFADGQVLHATHDGEKGEDAFFQLLKWEEGNFVIKRGVESSERSIHVPWRHLLMQSLQRIDEERTDSDHESDGRDNEGTLGELADRLDGVVAALVLDDEGAAVASLVRDDALDARAAADSLSDTIDRVTSTLSTTDAGGFEEAITITSQYRFITRPVGDGRRWIQVILDEDGSIGAARMHLAAYLATRAEEVSG
jgi:predicted regulator of Ras-like GTPase activity (Roadblock/LC7/MglB family)